MTIILGVIHSLLALASAKAMFTADDGARRAASAVATLLFASTAVALLRISAW